MKTAISLPEAARRLGVSRSEFFARAAERWLDDLDDEQTTEAINRALDGVAQDTAFVDAAADRLVRRPGG
jgi:antitoxin MazE6